MNITTKATIGDQVHILREVRNTVCHICAGTGKIRLGNGMVIDENKWEDSVQKVAEHFTNHLKNEELKEYTCPECSGKSFVKVTGQKKYEIHTCKVISMKLTIKGEDIPAEVKYIMLDERGAMYTVNEEDVYVDKDAAEKECAFLNLPRKKVPLAEIKITYQFAQHIPANEKLNSRLDEWKTKGKFETEIYVREDMTLFDGYTSYLVYKMLGIDHVPVVVWPTKKIEGVSLSA